MRLSKIFSVMSRLALFFETFVEIANMVAHSSFAERFSSSAAR